jgi:hypothetical protein
MLTAGPQRLEAESAMADCARLPPQPRDACGARTPSELEFGMCCTFLVAGWIWRPEFFVAEFVLGVPVAL